MNYNILQNTFIKLVSKYSTNHNFCTKLWEEIYLAHTQKSRHYHGMDHLNHLLSEITEIKNKIQSMDVVLFCLFYHDIVYKATKSNNETLSAEIAENRMQKLQVPSSIIKICHDMILATKLHQPSENPDTNIFLDADLSILGAEWSLYESYIKGVRKEFAIYPTFIFNQGRKKVINHFLTMPHIYKTDHFASKYELSARANLERELTLI